MNSLNNHHTNDTPEIIFNTNGNLLIKGISVPASIKEFYEPCINWINTFGSTHPQQIKLTFELEYLNTSSTSIFIEIIKLIKSFEKNGTVYQIIWKCYENDEDNIDMGFFLKESTNANVIVEYMK